MRIGSMTIRNTATLFTPYSRMCHLTYADPKKGKTTLAATLDKMTKRFLNKPSLLIACELAEGGGAASIEKQGMDFVQPRNYNDLEEIMSWLETDEKYGGVVLDSATETQKQFLQPWALKQQCREKNPAVVTARDKFGVPARGDYQSMGEKMREWLLRLVRLTTLGDPETDLKNAERRKHLFVTALIKTTMDDDSHEIVSIGPDLPGAMARTATAIFQTVTTLTNNTEVVPDGPGKTKRIIVPVQIVRHTNSKYVCADRFNLLPDQCEPDFEILYEKYWLPKIEANKNGKE